MHDFSPLRKLAMPQLSHFGSEYIRDLLDGDLDTRAFGERMGDLAGILGSFNNLLRE